MCLSRAGWRSATHPTTKNVPVTLRESRRSRRRWVCAVTRDGKPSQSAKPTTALNASTWKYSSRSNVRAFNISERHERESRSSSRLPAHVRVVVALVGVGDRRRRHGVDDDTEDAGSGVLEERLGLDQVAAFGGAGVGDENHSVHDAGEEEPVGAEEHRRRVADHELGLFRHLGDELSHAGSAQEPPGVSAADLAAGGQPHVLADGRHGPVVVVLRLNGLVETGDTVIDLYRAE